MRVQVRFNTLPTKGYVDKVGKRTTIRFLNHARSLAMCHVRAPASPPWSLAHGPYALQTLRIAVRTPRHYGLSMCPSASPIV